jgi:hypothetical protein
MKINNLDTYCEQVGRRGKDYETKRNTKCRKIDKCCDRGKRDRLWDPQSLSFSEYWRLLHWAIE